MNTIDTYIDFNIDNIDNISDNLYNIDNVTDNVYTHEPFASVAPLDNCLFCLDTITPNTTTHFTCCKKRIHETCFVDWIRFNDSIDVPCPHCRHHDPVYIKYTLLNIYFLLSQFIQCSNEHIIDFGKFRGSTYLSVLPRHRYIEYLYDKRYNEDNVRKFLYYFTANANYRYVEYKLLSTL